MGLIVSKIMNAMSPRAYMSKSMRGYDVDILNPAYNLAVPISIYITFLRCPRCAYLSFVKGRWFSRTRVSIKSIFHHVAFEHLMAREFHITCKFTLSTLEMDMMGEFEHELQVIKHDLEGRFAAEFRSVGADYIEWSILERYLRTAYMDWFRSLKSFAVANNIEGIELARMFVSFREFEVLISAPALSLCGKIDVLESGIPVEIKTGTLLNGDLLLFHELQVTYYALLLEYYTNKDVDVGEIYYSSINQQRRVVIDKYKSFLLLRRREEAMTILEKAETSAIFCRRCLPRGEAR